MNCNYCNELLKAYAKKHFVCYKCRARFYMVDNNIQSIEMYHPIGERTYTVTLELDSKKSTIHYTEPYPAKYTFGGIEPDIFEIVLTTNDLLPITPQNFTQKLKLYLTFL